MVAASTVKVSLFPTSHSDFKNAVAYSWESMMEACCQANPRWRYRLSEKDAGDDSLLIVQLLAPLGRTLTG